MHRFEIHTGMAPDVDCKVDKYKKQTKNNHWWNCEVEIFFFNVRILHSVDTKHIN